MKGDGRQKLRENMERARIRDYKRYYKEQMMQYDWNFTTAFHLKNIDYDSKGRKQVRALPIQECKEFIHYNILSEIKKRIMVFDRENRRIKKGIPFYAYYVICKQADDSCYHIHMIMRLQEQYANAVGNYIWILTGNKIEKLDTDKDVEKMVNYMLRKGNCVIDSDDPRMIPTGYNLKINKRLFN